MSTVTGVEQFQATRYARNQTHYEIQAHATLLAEALVQQGVGAHMEGIVP